MMSAVVRIRRQQETVRTMNSHPRRLPGLLRPQLASLLCPLVLLAACGGPSGQQRAAWELDHRLENRLAPNIAAGDAALQPLPDGARVTFLSPALFPNGMRPVRDGGGDVRANVVQGLLDPRLMRIQVADTSALPPSLQRARIRDLTQYLVEARLGPTLQPAVPPQGMPPGPDGAAPAGLTITINVQCPHDHEPIGIAIDMALPPNTDIQPPACQ
jgi:hypothetical protein